MHTFIGVRGVKREVETFEDDLSAQWTRYKMHGKEHLLKVAVRPLKFFEIVYPEDCHDDVMRMLMPFNNYQTNVIGKGLYFLLLPLMKALGIKKNVDKSVAKFHNYKVFHPYVDVVVLGHKPDRRDLDGTEKI